MLPVPRPATKLLTFGLAFGALSIATWAFFRFRSKPTVDIPAPSEAT